MRPNLAAGALAAGLLGTACSTPSRPSPSPPVSTTSSRGTSVDFDCSNPIDTTTALPAGYSAVADAVAFDVSTDLGSAEGSTGNAHRYFVKTGLGVRTGTSATIEVPADLRSSVSIGWDNHGTPITANRITIEGCPGTSGTWLWFPGGLSIASARCVPLDVSSGDRHERVYLSAGASCPFGVA